MIRNRRQQNSYTFVLVHGGCHDGSLWQPVIERLEQLGHTAYGPTVAGHGKDVPKNVTHAESTQSIVDFIVDRDLTDFILVGHGYAGTIISKVVEVIPERVRRLVFWSAYVLNDGETALEMLPDTIEMITQMAADSADNTFMIPFEMWREVFINDGDPDLVQRAYDQLSPEPFGPWAEPLNMKKFHSLQTPRSFLVGYCRHGDVTRRFGLASPHVKPARGVPVGPDAGKPRGGLYQSNRPCATS